MLMIATNPDLAMLDRLPLDRSKAALKEHFTSVIKDPVQLKMMLNDVDRNCRRPADVSRMYWNSRLSAEGLGINGSSWSKRKKSVVG